MIKEFFTSRPRSSVKNPTTEEFLKTGNCEGAKLFADGPERRKRARKIKVPLGPYETNYSSFETGKHRLIEIVRITPDAIVYRLKGKSEEFSLPHNVAFAKAIGLKANIDTGPREGKRITRSQI